MDILHVAFTLLCSVTPINDWVGDLDTGSNCIVVQAELPTIAQCEARLEQDYLSVNTVEGQRNIYYSSGLQGPLSVTQECRSVYKKQEVLKPLLGPPRR